MPIMQNNLCIIPARGGSKRIPRKNIKDFLGRPIISYSIEAARDSGLFKDIIVSTDDEEIAEVAIRYGAKVPFLRSKENADDFATTLDVIKEVWENCLKHGWEYTSICCIYPTAPFVTAEKLVQAFQLFENKGFESLLPVIRYSFPIQRSFLKTEDAAVAYQFPEYKNSRSQDLNASFHDAGQFYWLREAVLKGDSIINSSSGAIEIDELEGQDIDNETDWKLAELKYELLHNIK